MEKQLFLELKVNWNLITYNIAVTFGQIKLQNKPSTSLTSNGFFGQDFYKHNILCYTFYQLRVSFPILLMIINVYTILIGRVIRVENFTYEK